MDDENKIIDSDEVIKEIIERLSNKNKPICLTDLSDNSLILVSNDLLDIIRTYYKNKLIES